MAASPSHGEVRPSMQGFRRSSSQFASVPTRSLSVHEQAGLDKSDAAAEVLYSHPGAKIYKFAPPTDSIKSSSTAKLPHDTDYPVDTIETLPWRSRTETLLATGPLMIEKVRGSTNFLKCAELMHAVMKNSQCWCVDGESKFVMRVGQFRYYRIELPSTSEEDKKKVEELKTAMGKVLRYERTPCPFVRAFTVDLPDDALTPRRKGTWKRRESSAATTPESETSQRRSKTPRTWSLRGPPPSSFPSKFEQAAYDRPRTATTPVMGLRSDWGSFRTKSPASVASSEDEAGSDRQDTESDSHTDEHDSGHDSDIGERNGGGKELAAVDIASQKEGKFPEVKTPIVETQSASEDAQDGIDATPRASNVKDTEPPSTEKDLIREQISEISQAEHDKEALEDMKENVDSSKLSIPGAADEASIEPEANDISDKETDINLALPDRNEAQVEESLSHAENEKVDAEEVPDSERHLEPREEGGTEEALGHEVVSESDAPKHGIGDAVLAEKTDLLDEHEIIEPMLEHPQVNGVASDTTIEPNETDSGAGIVEKADLEPQEKQESDFELLNNLNEVEEHSSPSEAMKDIDDADLMPPSVELPGDENDDAMSTVSRDSFYTLSSDSQIDEDLTSSEEPLFSHLRRPISHQRGISDVTVRASIENNNLTGINFNAERTEVPPLLGSSASDSSWPDVQTPRAPVHESELRQRLRHRRSLSPMPAASNIALQTSDQRKNEVSKAILQKAANLAVVKPIEVVVLVFHILARIAGGATVNDLMSGELFRRPGARRTASGTFEKAQSYNERAIDPDIEDDFGVPLPGRRASVREDFYGTDALKSVDDDAASFASLD